MTKKIQMMSHDKEWQIVNGVETLVPVEQIDIDPITDSSAVQIEGHRTLEETLATKHQMTPEIDETKIMSKVGGVYHQNVVDGAYEEAILYGNSKVNLMEDDTTTAQSIPLTFTSFNNGLQKELVLGTNTVAPMLKGATLINRALTNSVTLASGEKFYIHNLKGNTVHTVSFKFTTKNTNAGVVIESCTGETYLENSMHKTGLGDNVIFTVTTHANADSIAIVNNAAYGGETIKLDDIMVIEGDQTLMNLTFFKGMRSVELVKPLTNLFRDNLGVKTNNTTVTNTGGTVTVTSSSSVAWSSVNYYLSTSLKQHTKYLVMWDSITKTHTSTANPEALISVYDSSDNTRLGYINNSSLCPTQRSLIFDTGDKILSNIVIRIHATQANTETGTTTVKGLRVFEWDDTTSRALDLQGIGYFSGTKNVSIPNFKTNSKNLYPYGDINFTPTQVQWHDAKGTNNMYGDIAQKSKCRFLLRKGTYKLSSDYYNRTNLGYMSLVTDKEEIIGDTTFTLDKDTYLTLRLQPVEANVPTTLTNIQIERGDTATDYVAYDTRQYKPDNQEVVVLRSLPNGVCDTFNLQTGEYVQRIGEAILDGTETQWNASQIQETDNYVRTWQYIGSGGNNNFITLFPNMKYTVATAVVNFNNDKLLSLPYDTFSNNQVVGFALKNMTMNQNEFQIRLPKSELASNDVAGIKTWLQQNPLKIYYELAEPIIKQIPIINNVYNASSKVDFKEGKNVNFRCFGNPTYLEVGSLSPVNPIVEPIINVPLNARLKANTSYTVRLDRTGSSLNVDLGGTTVSTSNSTDNEFIIKTPTGMLSHNQIRFSGNGRVGCVMVFEGDIRGIELPYFMGINNVKMPIVRNCGKNLVDFDRDKTNWWVNNEGLTKGDDTGLYYSVMIKASSGNRYKLTMKNTNRSHYGFLDENFNVLIANANNRDTVVAPKNTKYLIWYLSSTGLTSENNVQIELVENNNLIPTSYEPYRGNDICLVQGEIGLSQDMFEVGAVLYGRYELGAKYEIMKDNSYNYRTRLKELISIKPDTVYNINISNDKYKIVLHYFDASGGSIQKETDWIGESCSIKTPIDAYKVSILLSYKNDFEVILNSFDFNAYQILELDSTVQLRSLPNGVKDELNLLTGEYIQRVGEVVLNGNNNESWEVFTGRGGLKYFRIPCPTMAENNREQETPKFLIADKINFGKYSYLYESTSIPEDAVGGATKSSALGVQCIYVYYKNTDVIDTFKQYLQQNPITVQYQLAKPIISYPRIVSNTQEREVGVKLPNGVCDTYNPSTGITVKRVGKIVLDGSENWKQGGLTNDTYYEGWLPNSPFAKTMKPVTDISFINGNFVTMFVADGAIPHFNLLNSLIHGGMNIKNTSNPSDPGATSFVIQKSKMTTPTLDGFKQYLASNPITVWYELKHPIVTTDIVLPNGVHDEYNPLTGLYTKRVGYIELDGSETWGVDPGWTSTENLIRFSAQISDMKLQYNNGHLLCDKLPVVQSGTVPCIYNRWNNYIFLDFSASDINVSFGTDSNEVMVTKLKTYLSQNPIKVWYELDTPQKIQLTPYFGLPMPYAYQDGNLIMDSAYSGVSLPPEFKYKLVANRTGQVNQNNIKLQQHTTRLSNLEAMLVDATLQSMYEREMMAFNLEMVNINLINLEE